MKRVSVADLAIVLHFYLQCYHSAFTMVYHTITEFVSDLTV